MMLRSQCNYLLSYAKRSVALIALLMFSLTSYADDQQEITIPFKLEGNSPVVQAYLNKHTDPVNLLVDSGAMQIGLAFPERVAKEYKLPKIGTAHLSHNTFSCKAFTFQKLKLDNLKLEKLNLQNLNEVYKVSDAWGVCTHRNCMHDGVIGLSFFRQLRFNFVMDYPNHQLILVAYGNASNKYRKGPYVQSKNRYGIISEQTVSSVPVKFYWDTGASDSYISHSESLPSEDKESIAGIFSQVDIPLQINSQDTQHLKFSTDAPEICSKEQCSGTCAYVGSKFFRSHVVFFDLEQNRLYILQGGS